MSTEKPLPWWKDPTKGVDPGLWPVYDDFRNFLYVVWKHLRLPDPTPVQYDIANYLQNGPKRMMVQAFRGLGKSWITSALVLWLLLRDPQLKIMVVSASKDRATDFTTFTLQLIRGMPLLQHLEPGPDQRDSKISFDVRPATPDHAPSVKSVGITGQLTGTRADIIIPDDIETPKNSATQVQREKLGELVKEFDSVLKPLPTSRIIYLGTPQTEESVYNKLPERGYTVRIWPAQYPEERLVASYGPKLASAIAEALQSDPTLVGSPVDPKRFDSIDLAERLASYGRSGYSLQFMLDTSASDRDKYPLRLADLAVMDLRTDKGPEEVIWAGDPALVYADLPCVGFTGDRWYRPMRLQGAFIDYQGAVMAIDPSGRGKDETSYAVVKMLNGQLFLLASGGMVGGYDKDTLTALANIAKAHKVHQVLVEPNFGDGMFTELLRPVMNSIYPCAIEEGPRATIQKEKRIIDTLEPVMNSHRLIVDRKVVLGDSEVADGLPEDEATSYQLFHQMTRLTREKGALRHDDRLDALAQAVGYWVEQMNQDTEKQVQKRRDSLLNEELRKFVGQVIGRPRKTSRRGFLKANRR
jgi:hypothetical protein